MPGPCQVMFLSRSGKAPGWLGKIRVGRFYDAEGCAARWGIGAGRCGASLSLFSPARETSDPSAERESSDGRAGLRSAVGSLTPTAGGHGPQPKS